jgi:hypothetical protein
MWFDLNDIANANLENDTLAGIWISYSWYYQVLGGLVGHSIRLKLGSWRNETWNFCVRIGGEVVVTSELSECSRAELKQVAH